ncbi:glycoside hydrolase family 10 protein [Pirellulaceae bacterium SH467]
MNANSSRFLGWLYLVLALAVSQNNALPQSPADLAKLPSLPKVEREYRGVWVATVANIDWPSKPGLSTQDQQREAIAILDKVAELRMNVVVLQVRTSCDALYESKLEPWSYFLTGKQGTAPEPYYDPLEFWIHEAHRRGLELHAWFNPFRAKNSGQTYADSAGHISQTKPHLVKRYGNDKTNYLWLDPGEAESREHSLAVFLDVLRRYDVDGIHIDDYFYPYPVDDIPFPDDPAWKTYQSGGGVLARDDWRRDSMNAFIKQLYGEIKKTKPHVKFGISPFGIWKPGYPESVAGFSQHDKLYADARLWLNEGWCDYYTPQLYWSIAANQQSFPALLAWWSQENLQNRHLAPGLYTGRIGDKARPFSAEQIENQVFLSRYMPGSHGSIHFSMKALMGNREGISDRLRENAYSSEALTPECKWIEAKTLDAPVVQVESHPSDGFQVTWKGADPDAVRRWCLSVLHQSAWKTTILGRTENSFHITSEAGREPKAIAIYAINGAGVAGKPAIHLLSKE